MKDLLLNTQNSGFSKKEMNTYKKELNDSLILMNATVDNNTYETDFASLSLVNDSKNLSAIKKLVKQKQELGVDLIVVVGIGGSNLGTIAVLEAIHTPLYNHLIQPQLLFVDTCDSQIIEKQKELVFRAIANKNKVHVISVSKSGGTTETIANTQIFIDILEKNVKNYEKYVTIISDDGSKYNQLAEQKKYSFLPIPKNVGGRYSVFSSVGLFPLALAGININQLVKGAQSIVNTLGKQSPVLESAITRYLNYTNGKSIHDLFLFAPSLESIGKWYRQLVGESLGKEFSLTGQKVNSGFTPTVSLGSTDLHSVGQLYLGGPNDKYTTFVQVGKTEKSLIPSIESFDSLVPHIQKRSLTDIMDAILQGTQKAYQQKKIPFSQITLPELNEYTVGQLLQFFMCEIMLVGSLTNVNPFDQPNVENYKIHTKEILAKKQ